jgi:hypothetical protein
MQTKFWENGHFLSFLVFVPSLSWYKDHFCIKSGPKVVSFTCHVKPPFSTVAFFTACMLMTQCSFMSWFSALERPPHRLAPVPRGEQG